MRITTASRRVETAVIEALAEETYGRAALRVPFPDPLILARANGFLVLPTLDGARCWTAYGGQILYYPPYGDPRRRGDAVYHELAHRLFERHGIEHLHGDVYSLALALMAPWEWVAVRLRRQGSGRTPRLLIQKNEHAPELLLRLRVQQVFDEIASSRP